MSYRFYPTSKEAWAAMFDDIQSAEQSIYWEIYILLDDKETHRFFELLTAKARAGVSVKVVVDWIGSWSLRSRVQKNLRAAGGELLFFNRRWLFPRNHRKHLIVDNKIAYLGGVNVARIFTDWADLQVRLTTHALVRGLLRSFATTYQRSGGTDRRVLSWLKPTRIFKEKVRRFKVRLLDHWPLKGRTILHNYYDNACRRAKESILIITPYFVPHRWLIRRLQAAARRGVRVEVIMPEKTDHWLANFANYVFALVNTAGGIRFYLLPSMLHAKALLIDEQEGLVGSNNIDAQSFDLNIESSIVFERRDMIGDFRKIVAGWKRSARPFNPARDCGFWHRTLTGFFFLIQKFL